MAKQEFLNSLRIARNLFYHPRVASDDSAVDPTIHEQKIARAAIWLTPKSVNGFDAAEFPELGPARQIELRRAVDEFLEIARQVPANAPATPEQLGNAKNAFAKILHILSPYVSTSQEGEMVEEVLKSIDFPSWVVNWDYELGSDADGDLALWVNLYADESFAPRKEFGRLASRVTAQIRETLSAVGNNRWPYVRMRTAIEHKTA